MDLSCLAVEEFRGTNDLAAKCGPNGLMAKAHTQNWKFSGQALDQLDGNAGLLRRAWTGRNHDALGFSASNLVDGDLVVPVCLHVASQLGQILREGGRKGIVVGQHL